MTEESYEKLRIVNQFRDSFIYFAFDKSPRIITIETLLFALSHRIIPEINQTNVRTLFL